MMAWLYLIPSLLERTKLQDLEPIVRAAARKMVIEPNRQKQLIMSKQFNERREPYRYRILAEEFRRVITNKRIVEQLTRHGADKQPGRTYYQILVFDPPRWASEEDWESWCFKARFRGGGRWLYELFPVVPMSEKHRSFIRDLQMSSPIE
jgi:hypothetical protein